MKKLLFACLLLTGCIPAQNNNAKAYISGGNSIVFYNPHAVDTSTVSIVISGKNFSIVSTRATCTLIEKELEVSRYACSYKKVLSKTSEQTVFVGTNVFFNVLYYLPGEKIPRPVNF